jgi:hypothetical protein
MVVARYSPFYAAYEKFHGKHRFQGGAKYEGCYADNLRHRDLHEYKGTVVSPDECLNKCRLAGARVAGLQNGEECWCGDAFGKHGKAGGGKCAQKCKGSRGDSCGGPLENAIYTSNFDVINDVAVVEDAPKRLADAWQDATMVKAAPGESCDMACAAAGHRCDVHLFPLAKDDCPRLSELLGCSSCAYAGEAGMGFSAPGVAAANRQQCLMTTDMFLRCDAVPDHATFTRACVCRTSGDTYYDDTLGQWTMH